MAYQITGACTGCTACARACPVFAIGGERGKPHVINPRRCVECGVCGRICPQRAILDGALQTCLPQRRSLWPKPRIDSRLCSSCSLCIHYCTPGALEIPCPPPGQILTAARLSAPEKCVACGLCVIHCPLGAVTLENPSEAPPSKAPLSETPEERPRGKEPAGSPWAPGREGSGLNYAMVDLSLGRVEELPISEDYFRRYLGGKALAARLLLDLMPPGLPALDPASLIIINTGPLNGTGAPCSSRFNMSFKNVLTGGIASSNCGGLFGVMLKRAGFDGLVIRGRAAVPSRLEIVDGEIAILPAAGLWGLDTEAVQKELPPHHGKLVIGPAGENLVRFASAASGERMAGRCGGGAALGSKNLKALSAYGTQRPPVRRPGEFSLFLKKWVAFIRNHPMTGRALPSFGTAGLVNKANASSALPTHNFAYGYCAEADKVSGETLSETLLVRNSGCVSCPIRCERRVMLEGREVKGPEYETAGFFGPNIDAADMDGVIRLNYVCDLLGMDTISAASSIAFAMELREKGMADFGVEFGKLSNLEEVLRKTARREGIYSDLANGSKWLSEKYGGREFAMHSKGLEMASYEPRRSVGMGLGYATSNRGGCHLNGGYLALLESVGVLSLDPQSSSSKAELSVFFQDTLEAVSSAGLCLFTAQTFIPAFFFRLGPQRLLTRLAGKAMTHSGPVIRLLLKAKPLLKFNSFFLLPQAEAIRLATGYNVRTGDLLILGERSYNLERLFNLREGLTARDDSLPDRLTKTPQPGRPGAVVPLEKMLVRYYR
ncbi:MAG: 4Fe-4S binding protein, partial [Spirochaetales bacterium]|nr:4Fe-4S binding protein [Spirochaetales bacterium]